MTTYRATALLASLASVGWRPRLAWIVRWAPDGGDPLPAAWRETNEPSTMLVALSFSGALYEPARAAHARVHGTHARCDHRSTAFSLYQCEDCADAIRAAVPTLTLEMLARG